MDLKLLAQTQVLKKDSHFMPIIFFDMSIPTAAIVIGGRQIYQSVNQSVKDNKDKFTKSQLFEHSSFTPISASHENLLQLNLSIDDINY